MVLHGHKHFPLVLTDSTVTPYYESSANEIVVVSGGSVGSTALPSVPMASNTYNVITIKWVAAAMQARVRVGTRRLLRHDAKLQPLLPTQWTWKETRGSERIINHGRDLPVASAGLGRRFGEQDKDREAARLAEYRAARFNFPVVALIPSLESAQSCEARVWLVHHPAPPGVEDDAANHPVRVTWSAGPKFAVRHIGRSDDPHFCATFEFYGPMLVQAEMEFPDGTTARAHVYVRMLKDYGDAAPATN